MADLDIVNAFLGATIGSGVVGPIFERLIGGLKYVYHCKAECAALREELEMLEPMVGRIFDEHKGDTRLSKWLMNLENCIVQAQEKLEACKNNSSKVWERYDEVRYGAEILELKKKIQADVNLASVANLVLQSGSSKGGCGIEQEVPKKIFGMETHFKRVKSLILEGHKGEGSKCVGIRGMGGAGKTLLAQMVNNDKEIQGAFGEDSVIWVTVGRDAKVSVLYDRMRKRLQVGSDGGSIEDQCTELRNAFSKRQVLLILDDVWDGVLYKSKELVEWVNIAKGPGSVTLMTTRDESISSKCVTAGEEIILRLSKEESWELFCTHAFGTDSPILDKDMVGVVMDVCEECKCLPLALKVIGDAMRSKTDIREWRRTLHHLQESSTIDKSVEEQLFRRLQFSYDQLDESQKICFVYFAAFPEDCEIPVEEMCKIWVAEGLFGEDLDVAHAWDEAHGAMNELLRRSLIERCVVYSHARLGGVKMHDTLRDLAIQIASEGSECGRESLFKMVKKNVEEFPRAWLGSLMKVKRLSMWGDKIKKFPSDFIAPNLRICMLYPNPWESPWLVDRILSGRPGFKIEDDFFGNLQALRYLHICRNSYVLQLPRSMGGLGSLQHLDLSGCVALEQLPESMGGLGSLQHLNLHCCEALKQLPESMGELGSLEHLNLSWCMALKQLPESMGRLGSLQHLNLSWCKALKQLPESMGRLGSLQHLDLSVCGAFVQLPESMGGLGSLQHLDMSDCVALEQLPKSMGGLGSLQHLELSRCVALKQLPESMGGLGSLQHLDMSGCVALEQLPEILGGLESLQHLNLYWCRALKQLPKSMGGLGSLQHLDLSRCVALKQLPESMGGMGFLKYLGLSQCGLLEELPESMGGLGSLEHLDLSQCRALKGLAESMGGLWSLQRLDLRECVALEQLLESMGGLGSLQHLDMSNCVALEQLPKSMGGLGSLQHLDLSRCVALEQLPESLGGLESLQHLNLHRCRALKQFPKSMGGLVSLQHLDLSGCVALKQLPESMGGLGSLQHLYLSGCVALKQLPESMGGLGSLQHLYLARCLALKQLPESMEGLRSLKHLNLYWCRALEQLPKSMGGLGSLQHLNLKNCVALKGLPESMGGLGSLVRLDLTRCEALESLPNFLGLNQLRIIF